MVWWSRRSPAAFNLAIIAVRSGYLPLRVASFMGTPGPGRRTGVPLACRCLAVLIASAYQHRRTDKARPEPHPPQVEVPDGLRRVTDDLQSITLQGYDNRGMTSYFHLSPYIG